MVQAIIDLGQTQDRTLNVVKGKFGFKNKSDTLNFIIDQYQQELLEPELRPEFIEKVKKKKANPKFTTYSSIEELRKKIENVPL